MKNKYNLIVVQDDIGFKNLQKVWQDFEKSINHKNITSSFDWLITWWSIFKDVNNSSIGFNKKLLIVCLYDGDNLVAIAPFVKVYRKKFGIKISFIEFLGQQWAGNYLDIISDTKNAIYNNEIFQWLNNNLKYDLLLLKYIPQYSTNFNNDNLYLYSACPEIQIDEYAEHNEYIKNKYSKNLKQNLRTAYNKVKKADDLIKTSIEALDHKNFKETVRLSEFKLLDGKNSIFNDENKSFFMQEVTKIMTSNVVFVQLNGKNVAYRTNVIFNNNKFCLDASYDRNFRKYELGSISVDANLNDSFTNKMFSHCFGPGLDFYKKKFTKKNINIYMFIEKGNTFFSLIIFIIIKYLAKKKAASFNKELLKYQ